MSLIGPMLLRALWRSGLHPSDLVVAHPVVEPATSLVGCMLLHDVYQGRLRHWLGLCCCMLFTRAGYVTGWVYVVAPCRCAGYVTHQVYLVAHLVVELATSSLAG